jgi:hypothetical protein
MNEPRHPAPPPILDMTPDGEFRDAKGAGPLPPETWLDRALTRVGSAAAVLAAAAGGFLMIALAIIFLGVLIPILLGAGLIAFGSLWWRLRRARARGEVPPGFRFVVLRR